MYIKTCKLASALAFLICMICGLLTPALADNRTITWEQVQETLDCDGIVIRIDAMADTDTPETACEWRTEGKVWTEEELRHIVSIASPGDENMQRHLQDKESIDLYDDTLDTSASTGVGYMNIDHHDKEEGLDYATVPEWNTIYRSDEPLKIPVADLAFLSYQAALDQIMPVLNELDCTIGPPAKVIAWDVNALQANWERYHALYPEIGTRTWTTQEECYQIQFPVYYQGLRLNMQGDITNRDDLDNVGCYIAFLLNANGLISMQDFVLPYSFSIGQRFRSVTQRFDWIILPVLLVKGTRIFACYIRVSKRRFQLPLPPYGRGKRPRGINRWVHIVIRPTGGCDAVFHNRNIDVGQRGMRLAAWYAAN